MNTLQSEWESYRKGVMSKDCDKVQITETEQAFFAGGIATMTLIQSFAEYPEETAVNLAEGLHQELLAFFTEKEKLLAALEKIK